MRLHHSLYLFGTLILQSLGAPVDNAVAGPSSAAPPVANAVAGPSNEAVTASGSAVPSGPVDVVFGQVYAAKPKDEHSGPPEYNSLGGKKNLAHAFIPIHKDRVFYKGYTVTHSPPNGEESVKADKYGDFLPDSRILKKPRYFHQKKILPNPPDGVGRHLKEGKHDELKAGKWDDDEHKAGKSDKPENELCPRGTQRCKSRSKKVASRKSSTAPKIKAHNKSQSKKFHSKASQKVKARKGFAGKSKAINKSKGPAGGRGTSRARKGHK